MNTATIIVGNLVDDPELRYTANGHAVANFRIAVNNRQKNAAGEWEDAAPDFFRVNAWRDLAENVAESCTKGMRVVVAGRLKFRQWESDAGEKRSAVEVEADEVGPSLKFATAAVTRAPRNE